MTLDLSGKRIAISAGGAGIGRVMAERFAAAGARVAVCDIDDAAVADCRKHNPEMVVVEADVAEPQQVEHFYGAIEHNLGGLDVLINNAGISGPTKRVEDITDEEWNRTLAVNITGQFYMVRRAVPLLKAQRSGVIVNISSVAGRLGMPLRAPYSTTKYAARGLTDVLAVELGEFNIRVNAILPGLIDGPRGRRVMAEQATARGLSFEQYLPFVLHNISMHTMIGMDEIADMAMFLASDSARHITGQSISVCGNFETYRAPLQNS